MKYFQYFPQLRYQFGLTDGSTFVLDLTNITVRYQILARLKQHLQVMYDYVVTDGERPDSVAAKLYGSADYTWVVLLVNNIFSLYDWPLSSDEFERFIVDKYGSISAAQAQTTYRTSNGYLVDGTTYALLDAADRGLTSTAYDDEITSNEDKRRIKVIPTAFVEPLVLELTKSF